MMLQLTQEKLETWATSSSLLTVIKVDRISESQVSREKHTSAIL